MGPVRVFEKNEDVGGTWHVNTYPGREGGREGGRREGGRGWKKGRRNKVASETKLTFSIYIPPSLPPSLTAGCACDVPSHLYSLSFEQNADWSRVYPSQPGR